MIVISGCYKCDHEGCEQAFPIGFTGGETTFTQEDALGQVPQNWQVTFDHQILCPMHAVCRQEELEALEDYTGRPGPEALKALIEDLRLANVFPASWQGKLFNQWMQAHPWGPEETQEESRS